MKYTFKHAQFRSRRDELFLHHCAGKTVLHIGATDAPYTKQKLATGLLLHDKLCNVAKLVLGVDIDEDAIEYLQTKGFHNIMQKDMNHLDSIDFKADVIVFGETIEHLLNLESSLRLLRGVMNEQTVLLISTPNALYFNNIVSMLLYKESLHDDHKLNFTYGALHNLLLETGFVVENSYFTFLNRSKTGLLQRLFRCMAYFFVGGSETLVFVVKRNTNITTYSKEVGHE